MTELQTKPELSPSHAKLFFRAGGHSCSRLMQEILSVPTRNLHPKATAALKVKLKMLWTEGGAVAVMTAMERGIVGFERADL